MSKSVAAAEKPEVETPVTETVTEEIEETALVKGLEALEAEITGEPETKTPAAEPVVKPVEAASLAKTVEEKGSEVLAKSLEVSSTLKEITDLLGEHVDALSGAFAKSLTNQNAAILAITGVLKGLTKNVAELTKTVEKYGEKPSTPASAKSPETKAAEVLEKGAGSGAGAGSGDISRGQISAALMSLVKNAGDDVEQADRWTTTMVKYESTGQISDRDLHGAIKEHKRTSE